MRRPLMWAITGAFPLATAMAQTPPLSLAVPRAETIRGRVTNDSAIALRGATVVATRAPDRLFSQAVTDSAGRYEIRFEQGTGDYLIYATAPGYRAFRRRITLNAATEITVDIRLALEPTQLETVRVTAQRQRPIADAGFSRDPTAVDYYTTGVAGALPPDLAGSLEALAATTPGLIMTPDGRLSTFGMAGQVSTTFNGMELSTAELPRDAQMSVRVATSSYDPSIGGFGGARISVEMAQGARVSSLFGRLTLDAPQLQFSGAGSGAAPRATSVNLNANANGPFGENDAWYNTAMTVRRTTRDVSTLLNAPASLLELGGLSADSVRRASAIASRLGIPIAASSIPDIRADESFTILSRVDRYRDPRRYGKLWSNALSLTGIATANRSSPLGVGMASTPSAASHSTSAAGQLIGAWLYGRDAFSTELMSSLSLNHSSSEPYLRVPTAGVSIESDLGSPDPVTRTISIGGASGAGTSNTTASWETTGALYFYAGPRNKLKIHGRSRFTGVMTDATAAPGTFGYKSLIDLEQGRPSLFSRTLGERSASARLWNGAFAIGDAWQATPRLLIQPGVRFEATRFLTMPSGNPLLASSLGMDNTHVPNSVHASPRLGFSWEYRRARSRFDGGGGTIGRITLPPSGFLSGGIGEFRQDLSASALLPAVMQTGLSDGVTQLLCVGSATPIPAWSTYAADPLSIPESCAGGAPSSFVDVAPTVTLFDRSYAQPRSWRANLRFGSALWRFRYSADAAYSYNVDQPGVVDRNFAGVQRFSLANEANRPVFVPVANIVPSTGVASQSDSRRTAAFGRVTSLVSDLHSVAKQLTLSVSPDVSRLILSAAYTLSDVSQTSRGFDNVTFGSPLDLVTGRSGSTPQHRLTISAGRQFGTVIGMSLRWDILSGRSYTPVVASDVNGDGLANDQAFIFSPDRAPTSDVSQGLQRILSDGPRRARECLSRQVGVVAGRNSCVGPWTSTMNALISTGSLHVLDGRYLTASINLANPLGGLDELLHGTGRLHGWGAALQPDRVLYTVNGFDPVAKQYLYSVNPRFGDTRSSAAIRAPFRVTLDVRIELGRSVRQQSFDRLREMDAFRMNHEPAPVDTLLRRVADQVPNYFDWLIRQRDSLLLTSDQVEHLRAASAKYQARADSLWLPIARDMANRTARVDVNAIARRIAAVVPGVYALHRAELPNLRAGLAPAQLELADLLLKTLIESDKKLPPRAFLF